MINHIHHLEDLPLLEGNKGRDLLVSLLKSIINQTATYSIKYDGSPSLIFGINPETKRFFVGTKSAFNKVKPIRIGSFFDTVAFYPNRPKMQCILNSMLLCLTLLQDHFSDRIIQCEMLWCKGLTDEYTIKNNIILSTPNTITYRISDCMNKKLVLVPHTQRIKNINYPIDFTMFEYISNGSVHFVNPNLLDIPVNLDRINLKHIMNLLEITNFGVSSSNDILKKWINDRVRANDKYIPRDLPVWDSYYVLRLLKETMYTELNKHSIPLNDMVVPILNNTWSHEGFIVSNDHVSVKIVDRFNFSRINFEKQDVKYRRKKSKAVS